jgi:hypothetical protein
MVCLRNKSVDTLHKGDTEDDDDDDDNNNNNNNGPDVTVVDKTNKQAVFIVIAIPLAQNLQATNT